MPATPRALPRAVPSSTAALALLALVLGRALSSSSVAAEEAPAATSSFRAVKAILDRSCTACHRAGRALGGLALDTWPAIRRGGAAHPVLVAGHPEQSLLVARVRGRVKPAMPTEGKALAESEIRLLEAWIAAGAKGPEGCGAAAGAGEAAVASAPAADGARGPLAAAGATPTPDASGDEPLRWRAVAPILRDQCVRCHEGEATCAPGGLRYDSYAATIAGGACVSVVPGHPEASALVRSMKADARARMPADGPPYACAATIARLERWIADGARDDDGRPAPIPVGRPVCVVGRYDGRAHVGDVVVVVDDATVVAPRATAGADVVAYLVVEADGALRARRLEPAPAREPAGAPAPAGAAGR